MLLVGSTKNQFASFRSFLCVIHPDSKDGLVKQILAHHFVQWRHNVLNGNRIVPKAENSIKAPDSKRDSCSVSYGEL